MKETDEKLKYKINYDKKFSLMPWLFPKLRLLFWLLSTLPTVVYLLFEFLKKKFKHSQQLFNLLLLESFLSDSLFWSPFSNFSSLKL
ncbi:hypothetical protein IEQ34_008684 [Dendrobium chrysotoxum]|uniref:Uncharacterized protein n=1 Tax=Dendrobium chrysotoxum TaxID=161865 RepID=A0AAV7GZD3_DENCH|nr:hypothetical protein IEQ34_008684 [Dendrobium chrysotoxum]